ncbi:GNAT family N-acetyltransferase [Vibrio sp. ZSDE26]|uniref:GNAT family N-acetyltransferase n=1 Tax=Vibrio amylolyticus TaxID=2847292 RepID=A0A9X1XFD2_9VIBR|nr:GNAT family N-acetyltransferase [Vibrio amylolyticus]MCK6261751.1 GNAT family N-acetyltransferase [Vibrio amylolyticus]
MIYQYIEDKNVTPEMDEKLRGLLSASFLNRNDSEIFSRQRFLKEMPQHRYLFWDDETLIAHIAVHDKQVMIDEVSYPVCGIAEVCVHADYRKQGLVKKLLNHVHQDGLASGYAFSILFGDENVYGSSGYQHADNLKLFGLTKEWVSLDNLLMLALNKQWPEQEVRLSGIPF